MDVERSELHDLNAVGGRIWKLTDGHHSVADIVDALTEEYDVERSRAESEVCAYLDKLREKGLIVERLSAGSWGRGRLSARSDDPKRR